MANRLRQLVWLGCVWVAPTLMACRASAVPTASPTSTIQSIVTLTPRPSAISESPTTLAIVVPTLTPTATAVLPTATRFTPTLLAATPNVAPSTSTLNPTLPPPTRMAAAESLRGTAIAEATATAKVSAAQTTLTPGAAGTQTATPLDAYQLIERGWLRGEIDLDHAAVFRLYSLLGGGRARVPPQYLSDILISGDGLGLFMYAFKDWPDLNPATQATMGGYTTPRQINQAELLATPTATPATRLPSGAFMSAIVAQDNVTGPFPMMGQWTFDVTSGAVMLNGKRVITRSIYQRDQQVILLDEYGSYACEDVGQEGVYTWVSSGNTLVFTKVNDSCGARSQLLTAHPWVKP